MDRQHNGQKIDRQHNGQKMDRQHNGQKMDRQHNGQKKKYKGNTTFDLQNITQKIKDRVTQTDSITFVSIVQPSFLQFT